MAPLNPVLFELVDSLRILGLRDRRRCPKCAKIGTWKSHGGLWDRHHGDTRAVRRWLCKWCGYYVGPEGVRQAYPSKEHGAWALTEWGFSHEPTPAEAIEEFYGRPVNPWRG